MQPPPIAHNPCPVTNNGDKMTDINESLIPEELVGEWLTKQSTVVLLLKEIKTQIKLGCYSGAIKKIDTWIAEAEREAP